MAADASIESAKGGAVPSHHASITIDRPADEVASYIFDPSNIPDWSAFVTEVETPSKTDASAGVRLRARLRALGSSVRVEGELTSFDLEKRRAAFRVKVPGIDLEIEGQVMVEDLGGSAAVTFLNHVSMPDALSVAGITDKFVSQALGQSSRYSLANIKAILEMGQQENLKEVRAQVEATQN